MELTGSTSELVMAIIVLWLMVISAMVASLMKADSGLPVKNAIGEALILQIKLVGICLATIAFTLLVVWAIAVVFSAVGPMWEAL